ncbi:MAG: ArsR/SmtB family transcription factor [Candidatus Binatia bacterium]
MPHQKKELSDAALEMIADRFKILAEPMRLKILHALWDGEKTVSDIIAATNALQANVSKHLGILQQAGLVRRRRDGLNVYYEVADESIFDLCEAVCESLHDRLTAQMDELALTLVPRRRVR